MSFDCMPGEDDPKVVGMFGQTLATIMKEELAPADGVETRRARAPSLEILSPGHHSVERSASAVGCVFAMLATIVGGGALSLPYALKALGLGPGLALTLAAAYASESFFLLSLAHFDVVRADSLTGAHLCSRSQSLEDISLAIARLWGAT